MSRWARLPVAINGKPKHKDNLGEPFHCRLTEWRPEKRYTPHEILAHLELEQAPGRRPKHSKRPSVKRSEWEDDVHDVLLPQAAENPVVAALKARGLYKTPLGSGKHDITCPWVEEHTDALDTGAAYFEPDDLYPLGGFCCQHSHGERYHIKDLLAKLEIPNIEARHKSVIRVIPGDLHGVVDAAEKELAARGRHFQSGGLIVSISTDPTTVRKWLRENIPGFANMKLSDGEIIENYLVPARRFVEQGGTAAQGALAGAFSREWFRNSEGKTEADANRELAALTRNMRPASTEAEAREAAKSFITRPPLPPHNIENLETDFIANVSWGSFNKMVHHTARKYSVSREAHFLAVANVDKLFRLATRDLPPRKGFKEGDDAYIEIEAIHHFDAPMLYKGEILLVEMIAEQYITPDKTGHRIYTLQSVEIGTPASQRGPQRLGFPSSSVHPPAGVGPRFAQMARIVKGEVKPDDIRFSRSAAPAANPANGLNPFRDRMERIADTLIYTTSRTASSRCATSRSAWRSPARKRMR